MTGGLLRFADLASGLSAWQAEDERRRLQGSLKAFMGGAWQQIEPLSPFIDGFHIDAIADHLEAVERREIRTLVVNLPPRHLKSTLIGVFFPAWLWARRPSLKLMTGSYALPLATRDATKSRRIITSSWYTERFPAVKLHRDQKEKTRYENTAGGGRYCFSTGGTVTGEGADVLIWDDPHKAMDVSSPNALETAVEFWRSTLPSRLNDPVNATKLVVMQRLAPNDITGEILKANDPDVVHLRLPARYDPARPTVTRWFRDPRTEKGQLLWPERMNARAIRLMTKDMTPGTEQAQMDQDPTAGEGKLFPRKLWRVWTAAKMPVCELIVVSHDPAFEKTEDGSKFATIVWGVFKHQEEQAPRKFATAEPEWHMIPLDGWSDRLSYPEAKRRLIKTVDDWTLEGVPPDHVMIEAKAAGAPLLRELANAGIENLRAYNPGKLSKYQRAKLYSDIWVGGRVWVPGRKLADGTRSSEILAKHAEGIVAEMELFPSAGVPDDYVDCASQAAALLRNMGMIRIEDTDLEEESVYEERVANRESVYG